MKFVKLLGLIFIFYSCSHKNEKVSLEYLTLEPTKKITFESDNYFLSNVQHMDFNHNTYILVEYEYNRVTLLNKDHTLKTTITGEGNELTDINYPMIAHGNVTEFAIFNAGNSRVGFYNYEGEYQSSFLLKSATSGMTGFSFKNNKIYHSVDNGITPFVRVNTQTNKVENIGLFHHTLKDNFEKIYKSGGKIFELEDQGFVTIFSAIGEVVLYNSDSEILSTFNINEIDEFKTTAKLLEEFNLNSTSYSVRLVFEDSKLLKNKLYVLAYLDKEPKNPSERDFTLNHIIQINIGKDNKLKVEKVFKLDGASWFNTFAISNDNIITVSNPAVNQLWTYELR